MRYFNYLDKSAEEKLFYKLPTEFNKDSNYEILRYVIGGLLYVPANKKEMILKCINKEIKGIVSVAICLEDAVGPYGEKEGIKNLEEIFQFIKENKINDLPLIFIRTKDIEQTKKIRHIIDENINFLKGLIIPKADSERINQYMKFIKNINYKDLKIMPIIESKEFVQYGIKDEYFKKLIKSLITYKESILSIRIGVTDLLGLFGVRRDKELTIYDNFIFNRFASDILSAVYDLDIPVSGGVSEFYNMSDSKILSTYIKEIKMDKFNGFIGKTIIHPMQLKVVQCMNAISYEDYKDAKSILNSVETDNYVSADIKGEKMNEVNPHLKWAKNIIVMSKVYGVLNKGVGFNELYELSM
ncbi:MAG: ATP-binding protein [Clostridium sp.]|nr:ATP-binding protein [Clostridium sp.]